MNLGPDSPNTGDFDIDLRPGTRVGVYSLTVVGYNGTNDLLVLHWKVRVFKKNDGTFEGLIVEMPEKPLPSWATQPVIDSTATGGRVSYLPANAVWKTTVSVDLISALDK